MTLSTKIEVFYGFYICSQWAFIHALLSRVPFALAGLSCILGYLVLILYNRWIHRPIRCRRGIMPLWLHAVGNTAGVSSGGKLVQGLGGRKNFFEKFGGRRGTHCILELNVG